jgi:outer membrane receptor protein involved in Fe transport
MPATKYRAILFCAACVPALAATAQAQEAAPASDVETVTVTGSRLSANGFSTPTPVTVMSADVLKAAAPVNLADGLNQLPVFANSIKTQNPTTTNQPGATSGQNLLNLRGLGANRTLVLLNGERMPATNSAGSVDVDTLPQGLVTRVDVVTGGASAAYGSDAVSGVVNFVLDTHFEGLKAEAQGGISTYGDLASQGGSITFGTPLLDGRLHIVANVDYFHQDGLPANEKSGRGWFDFPAGRVPNPNTPAVPASIFIPDVRSSVGSYGGLITAGPLKGLQFGPGGVLEPFDYGTDTGTAYQSGGDGGQATIGLMPEQARINSFVRAEYDIDSTTTAFVEGLYSHSHTLQGAYILQSAGTSNQYTIFNDNAYLPAAVKALMAADNITSFKLGRFEADLPLVQNEDFVDVYHGAAGLKGTLWSDNWTWNASYTFGQSRQWLSENNLSINRNLYAAADAVVNPQTGAIVCRSQYYNAANVFVPGGTGEDPGCVPRNLFGPNQPNNPTADGYVLGTSLQILTITQQVAQANVAGDLGPDFNLGAGPINIATGVEYRREAARQLTDPISQETPDYTGVRGVPAGLVGKLGGFRTNNPQPFRGDYDIKEAYLEIGVPVLKDLDFAKSLDVDAAVRYADYSTGAGGVTTWKIGGNYQITDEYRLRITRSQDIRGADVIELFNPSSFISNNTIYPCSFGGCNGKSVPTLNIASGNTNLKPEDAQTLTYGGVYSPEWLDGFQISVDYYNISIKDAIGSLGSQQEIDQCAQGNQALCALVQFNPATGRLTVFNPTLNLSVVKNAGIDFEAQYTRPLFDGSLSTRLLVNNRQEDFSQAPGSPVQQGLNSPISPRWRANLQLNYTQDDWSIFLQERWQYHSLIDPTKIVGIDLNYNHVPDITYTDITLTYRPNWFQMPEEVYLSINNLFNQTPPLSPPPVSSFTTATSPAYDPIGRYFTVGIRVTGW